MHIHKYGNYPENQKPGTKATTERTERKKRWRVAEKMGNGRQREEAREENVKE